MCVMSLIWAGRLAASGASDRMQSAELSCDADVESAFANVDRDQRRAGDYCHDT